MRTVRIALSISLLTGALALSGVARADDATPTAGGAPAGGDETTKTFYALGLALAQSLDVFALSEGELNAVIEGLTDSIKKKKLKVEFQEYKNKIRALAKERAQKLVDAEKNAAGTTLDKAASEKGAVKTESGLVYLEMKAGNGPSPKASDKVKVHYHGTLRDGTVFDSSVQRNEPATFPLDGVIPCWTEGVQKMKVGGKAKLTCPSKLAYGERGSPPNIRPGAVLTFEIELLGIEQEDKAAKEKEGEGKTEPKGEAAEPPKGDAKDPGSK